MSRRRAALALLAACSLSVQTLPAVAAPDVATVVSVTQLPPPPPHEWPSLQTSLNENRVHGNGLVSMPVLQTYLNGLYAKIKASAGVPEWPGEVYISADTTLNAHSSASGNLFLHIALIQSAESEDEIYAVLAHEFAHVYLNHQATYETHTTAANLSAVGKLVGLLAGKINPAAGSAASWGLADTIGAADSMAHDALIPVWQRDVEAQADMAGVYLTMQANYSYPAGFKTFLERLATIEARDAAVAAAAASAAAAAGTNAGPGPGAPRRTHASAQEREAVLTAQVAPFLPRPRPAVRKAPWQAALRDPQTAEILAHFALLPVIAQKQAAGRLGEALQLAKQGASGATEGDATMLLTLQNAMRLTGAPQTEQGMVLMKNREWKQPSWNALRQGTYLIFLPGQPARGKEMIELLYAYFYEPPAAMPDVIAFYTAIGEVPAKTALLLRCSLNGNYRAACGDAAKTEQERQQDIAKQKAREEQLGNNGAEKIKKFFKLK